MVYLFIFRFLSAIAAKMSGIPDAHIEASKERRFIVLQCYCILISPKLTYWQLLTALITALQAGSNQEGLLGTQLTRTAAQDESLAASLVSQS